MNLQEIRNFLKELFSKPLGDGKKRHIVFWYDSNEDFVEDIDNFDIEGVKIIKLTDKNAFWSKYQAILKEYLDEKIKIYEDIDKFGDLDSLWHLITRYYGYNFDERSLERFMAMLLITNMNETVKFELPKQFDTFISKNGTNNIVFINHFMNNSKDSEYYDKMQELIGGKLKIDKILEKNSSEIFVNFTN